MTPSEARRRIMVGAVIGVTINAAITVGGYILGAKYKHPVAGALLGFFFVGPAINAPIFYALTSEAMETLDTFSRMGQQAAPSGAPAPLRAL